MFKTKRKRAVVLALIAFFCTATATYVAVDWKRFGGGFLAFFKSGKGDAIAATGGTTGSKGGRMTLGDSKAPNSPALPLVAAATSRRHTSGVRSGADGHKSDDDLFKYGDPAAGGIPPGSFIVAQNDTPGGGNDGGAGFAPTAGAPAAPEGEGSGPGTTSPAPAPAGTNAGTSDGGLSGGGNGTPPAPMPPAPAPTPPVAPPPAGSPPAATPPAPAPTQSGTTDDPGTLPPAPSPSLPPISAVPEASSLAMMSLGALFLAAAARKRKQG
jgi:hypothetical protein